jgi:hypothetical protein
MLTDFTETTILSKFDFFFGGGRDSNSKPCIYYALSIPTKLSSRGPLQVWWQCRKEYPNINNERNIHNIWVKYEQITFRTNKTCDAKLIIVKTYDWLTNEKVTHVTL